ncbi:MAG TPA: Rieske 2Fe-2S domain-containing protein [Blastocatellia bacterium]|nr:Rieske 2Fe-2S domain-containing protein [Blastocatellia bacterium]
MDKVNPSVGAAEKIPATSAAGVPSAARTAKKDAGEVAPSVPTDEASDRSLINRMRRRLVWTSVVGFLTANFLMFLRFFFPRALFEPSTVFRIGYPSDFAPGVDTRFQDKYRIWVVRTADRLFVIYARCTHLGCTPNWSQGENKFKCPCHGSGYDMEGINFEGPAPRPMDRAKVELDAEGQIVVDVSKLYSWPKGGPNQFNEPGSYIPV